MRVVQVSCFVDPLGRRPEDLLAAWPSLAGVAAAARRAGVDVTVVQAASLEAEIVRDDVRCVFVREQRASPVRRRAGLWALPLTMAVSGRVAELWPEVVHFHGLSQPRHLAELRRRIPGVPVLVQDHADRLPPRWRRAGARSALAGVAGAAFTTRAQAEPFIKAGVLPGGVPVFEVLEASTDFTTGDLEAARAATGIGGDPCLLWLGHLNANKDPLTVLDALSRAAPSLNDPQLWCCFLSAPLLRRVQRRIAGDPALKSRVHLLGPRPRFEVERLLRAADFLVQGSHREGSGYAVIEALACGTTPLVTDIPPFRRITGNGAVGSLTPAEDSQALAGALREWTARDRRRLRHQARDHFERHLSFDAVGRELRTAYAALLEDRGDE